MESKTTKKPWGEFVRFTKNESSTVKLIKITKGEELSLQYHKNRDEFIRVIFGTPKVVIGDDISVAKEGDEFFIKSFTKHRFSATDDDVVMLEISKGDFDEEDIVRLEDKYGR